MVAPIRRHALERLKKLLGAFPVVAITGARQVGKSTLAQMALGEVGGVYRTLDAIATRSQAIEDAEGFVGATDGLTVIDEIQLVPGLLRAIKLSVDIDRRPGRFLITGSANLLKMRTVTESLAGRSAWLELGPLSWPEIVGAPMPRVLDVAFAAKDASEFLSAVAKPSSHLAEATRIRAIAGGMPPTLGLDSDLRREWYDGYRQTFIERDLRQLSQIENLPEFSRLLSLAMLRTGGVLNKSDLGSDAGLAYPTLRRYLGILEVAYQVWELAPYFVNAGKRLVKTPKLYAGDVGMAAHIANIRSWDDATSMARDGALLETWVMNEIVAANQLAEVRSSLAYWRRSAGPEVDCVLERGDAVVGIEVKATGTVSSSDTRGLRALRDDLGPRFRLGIVAHTGLRAEVLDSRLVTLPIASLLGATG
jgi:predicted AAA+ superfamily ATPase